MTTSVQLYDRRCSVTIKPEQRTREGQRTIITYGDEYPEFSADDNPGKNGLRIVFSIEKTIGSDPNRATVRIFNMLPEKRAVPQKGDLLSVAAGYVGHEPTLPVVFKGVVSRIEQRRRRADWETVFSCGDGLNVAKRGWMNSSTPPGGSIEDSFEQIKDKIVEVGHDAITVIGESFAHLLLRTALSASDPTGAGTASGGDDSLPDGESLVGNVGKLLTGLCNKVGATWSVQNNTLIIRPKDGVFTEEPVILSTSTGLVESPQRTEKGVSGRALLIPELDPGRLVLLETLVYAGEYVITRANINADTHGSDWSINWEAMEPGTSIPLGAAGQ